jgi:hypothetical protein
MNPCAVEEGAKVAGGVVDALRSQPVALALIVITAVFMYFVWNGVRAQREQTHEILKVLLDRCASPPSIQVPK